MMDSTAKQKMEQNILKQRECLQKAKDVVTSCIDGKCSEKQLLSWIEDINDSYYDDITEERALQRICGYPICDNKLSNFPKKKYHISTLNNKVYDISERKKFCSNECYVRSKFLKNQLPTSPVWLKDEWKDQYFTLLDAINESCQPGDEVDLDYVSVTSNETCKNAAADSAREEIEPTNKLIDSGMISSHVQKLVDEEVKTDVARSNSDCAQPSSVPEFSQTSCKERISDVDFKECVDADKDFNRLTDGLSSLCVTATSIKNDHSRQTFANSKMRATKERSKSKLIDAVPEAFTKPKRKIKIIDPLPIATAIAKHENSRLSAISKTSKVASNQIIEEKPVLKNNPESAKSESDLDHWIYVSETVVQWSTPDTVKYIVGKRRFNELVELGRIIPSEKCDFDFRNESRYREMCRRLDVEEMEDGKSDDESSSDDFQTGDKKPIPDMETLKKQSLRMQLNVAAYFRGKFDYYDGTAESAKSFMVKDIERQSVNCSETRRTQGDNRNDDNEANNDDRLEPILPLVDSHSQMELRRRIVVKSLVNVFSEVLAIIECDSADVASSVKDLVATFNLSSQNVILRPTQWKLCCLILLQLLTHKEELFADSLIQRNKTFEILLDEYNISVDELNSFICNILHIK